MEKILKENAIQTKSLNIIDSPEIIAKLKNKIDVSPEKLKRMNNKWSKYENEQKLILSELNEEINKKRVSILKQHIILQYIIYLLYSLKWIPIFQRTMKKIKETNYIQ